MISTRSGVTLIELIIGLTIGSLVVAGMYQSYIRFTRGNLTERQSLEIQNHIAAASGVIEKDIRMAGYRLPGNGLGAIITTGPNCALRLFTNDLERQSALAGDAPAGNTIVRVLDGAGVEAGQWICLSGADTVFYPIERVCSATHEDTIYLADTALTADWPLGETAVYFARSIRYGVETYLGEQWLVRATHDKTTALSPLITRFAAAALDENGQSCMTHADLARTLEVTIGSVTVDRGDSARVSETFQTAIRNL
jgi:prepilin-type N-terminal cleavage/methylation domain-containing protein